VVEVRRGDGQGEKDKEEAEEAEEKKEEKRLT